MRNWRKYANITIVVAYVLIAFILIVFAPYALAIVFNNAWWLLSIIVLMPTGIGFGVWLVDVLNDWETRC